MSQPRSKRKAQAQARRTQRHEAKRREVRNAYRPRSTGKGARQTVSYRQARRAVDFALLHHYLMGQAQQRTRQKAA